MAKSTAPILAVGGISFVNKWIGNNQGIDVRILVATGIAATVLAVIEKANEPFAVGIAWLSLLALVLTPPRNGNAPVTNLIRITGIGKP